MSFKNSLLNKLKYKGIFYNKTNIRVFNNYNKYSGVNFNGNTNIEFSIFVNLHVPCEIQKIRGCKNNQ